MPPKPPNPDDLPPGWTEHAAEADGPAERSGDFLRDASRGPRLQKVLAAAGVASRRACEALVEEGAVRVNGHAVTSLPAWVDPSKDRITVNGRRIRTGAPTVCVMLFKPRGVICTSSDPEERKSALDLVQHPSKVRLFAVGRLDMDSSGLLLLTNDGEFSNLLSHPSHHVRRIYDVTVTGQVEPATIRRLERGINLPDVHTGRTRPARFESVKVVRAQRDRTKLRVTLTEGRNRQIRRMMLMLGHPVRKLRRVAIGPLKLADLRPGQWRDLTTREIAALTAEAHRPRKKRQRPPKRTKPRPPEAPA
ncbi:MAG: pseudouridine synthase [Phycisphaerales bacterium]|jgi:pseudouridine synthase|nr:pseudouridine synthase [Phycisphaerales bacterium]